MLLRTWSSFFKLGLIKLNFGEQSWPSSLFIIRDPGPLDRVAVAVAKAGRISAGKTVVLAGTVTVIVIVALYSTSTCVATKRLSGTWGTITVAEIAFSIGVIGRIGVAKSFHRTRGIGIASWTTPVYQFAQTLTFILKRPRGTLSRRYVLTLLLTLTLITRPTMAIAHNSPAFFTAPETVPAVAAQVSTRVMKIRTSKLDREIKCTFISLLCVQGSPPSFSRKAGNRRITTHRSAYLCSIVPCSAALTTKRSEVKRKNNEKYFILLDCFKYVLWFQFMEIMSLRFLWERKPGRYNPGLVIRVGRLAT